MYYFADRVEAGQILAKRLQQYKGKRTAVMAVTIGGVLVGEYIAKQLGAPLTLLMTRSIMLPGEPTSFGTVSQTGSFTVNSTLAKSEVAEFEGEFHNHIEAEKMSKLFELNKSSGRHTMMDRHLLKNYVVILTADGLIDAAVVEAAYEYLKPIQIKRLVAATPMATVAVVDKLHVITDEIHCLSVLDGQVFDVDHYYTNNAVPEEAEILNRIDRLAQA